VAIGLGVRQSFSVDARRKTKMQMLDKYFSERIAARLLRKSPATLASWRARGRGPAFTKIGAAIVYTRADLNAWLRSQRVDPAVRKIARAAEHGPRDTDDPPPQAA
jgi:hypothetical protein